MAGIAMDDFIIRALVAGAGVAAVAGPVGCFVVWRRMAYFGAALAHAALLGVALGFLLSIDLVVGVTAVCVAVALGLVGLQRQHVLADDTLLGILAHAALAAGLIAIAFLDRVRVDLMAYLFGDILAVGPADLLWIWGGGAVALAALAALWRPLLSMTVHEDLARVDGVPVARVRLAFMLLISVVIAVAMKLIGVLLIVSMLIIPAATARRFAATPEGMAILAAAIGIAAVGAGIAGSLAWDTPAGPSIVAAASLGFFAAFAVRPRTPG
jgi:zinc transport system permease protein